jgi:hypothetical protein
VRNGSLWTCLTLLTGVAACGGDGAEEAAAAAESCVASDLVAQCPPGSDPIFEASATSRCEGSGEFSGGGGGSSGTDLPTEPGTLPSGRVEGVCEGEGGLPGLLPFPGALRVRRRAHHRRGRLL